MICCKEGGRESERERERERERKGGRETVLSCMKHLQHTPANHFLDEYLLVSGRLLLKLNDQR